MRSCPDGQTRHVALTAFPLVSLDLSGRTWAESAAATSYGIGARDHAIASPSRRNFGCGTFAGLAGTILCCTGQDEVERTTAPRYKSMTCDCWVIYEPRGRGFESCQPHHQIKHLPRPFGAVCTMGRGCAVRRPPPRRCAKRWRTVTKLVVPNGLSPSAVNRIRGAGVHVLQQGSCSLK